MQRFISLTEQVGRNQTAAVEAPTTRNAEYLINLPHQQLYCLHLLQQLLIRLILTKKSTKTKKTVFNSYLRLFADF
jgi:hypothetical protein